MSGYKYIHLQQRKLYTDEGRRSCVLYSAQHCIVSLYNTLAWVRIERGMKREEVKEGREGRREREIPIEIPINREEVWRVSWGGEGRWTRGRKRLVVMTRQEMKEGKRGMGWEGIRRQRTLARRSMRVGRAVAEPVR